jgi:hypothetical protein
MRREIRTDAEKVICKNANEREGNCISKEPARVEYQLFFKPSIITNAKDFQTGLHFH